MINLHTNFLEPEERSNPCEKLLSTGGVAAGIAAVAGVVLYILFTFISLQAARSSLRKAQELNNNLRQNHKFALDLSAEISALEEMKRELESFSNAQIKVSDKLISIAANVPDDVQFTSLKLGHELAATGKKNDVPARKFFADLSGRTARTDDYDKRIGGMIESMKSENDARNLGKVIPGGVSVDTLNPAQMLFDIRLEFAPLGYKCVVDDNGKNGATKWER